MNNIFTFATGELSQDAFICWCLNWINYPNEILYPMAKDIFSNLLISPFWTFLATSTRR